MTASQYGRRRLERRNKQRSKGLAAAGRTRTGFDLSVHPALSMLLGAPQGMLRHWQQLGFTLVIAFVGVPFPYARIEQLAHELGLS